MGFLTFLNENTEVKKSITAQTLDESFNAKAYDALSDEDVKAARAEKVKIEDAIDFEISNWDVDTEDKLALGTIRFNGKKGDTLLVSFAVGQKVEGKKVYKAFYAIYNTKEDKLVDIVHRDEPADNRTNVLKLLNDNGAK